MCEIKQVSQVTLRNMLNILKENLLRVINNQKNLTSPLNYLPYQSNY